MRPLRLEFQAFGSYPGREVVDFTVLAQRGLYLVSGDTGTGKSTIFDAMCFALYGAMPHKQGDEVRSHHAAPDVETVVHLEFESDGARYTATRSPEYERPAKRGGGTTKQTAAASIVRHEADGSTTAMASSVRSATAFCVELLGLDATQFQRVVLLPQGKVAEFLTADSKTRETLLGQLFGGKVYDRLVLELKARRDRLHTQVGEIEARLRAQLEFADQQRAQLVELLDGVAADDPPTDASAAEHCAWIAAQLAAAVPALAARTADVAALREAADAASAAFQHDQAALQRFDDHRLASARLAELEVELPSAEVGEAAATRSATARSIVSADEQAIEARARHATAATAADECRLGIARAGAAAGVEAPPTSAGEVSALVGALRLDQAGRRRLLEAVALAADEVAGAEATRDRLRDDCDRVARDRAEVAVELDRIRARLAELGTDLPDVAVFDAAIDAAVDLVQQRQTADGLLARLPAAVAAATVAANEHAELLARFVATQAPRLASQLEPGQPCAVCGSREHPRPALADDGRPTAFEDVTAAAARRDEAGEVARQLEADLRVARERLGADADTPAPELDERLATARTTRAAAVTLRAERDRLTDEQSAAVDRETRASTEYDTLSTQLEQADQQVAARAAVLDQARTAASGVDELELERVDAAIAVLEVLGIELTALDSAVTEAAATAVAAERTRDEALAASPFTSADEARAAVLDASEERRLLAAAAELRAERERLGGSLQTLTAQGVPDVRPDVGASEAARDAAVERHRAAAEVLTRAEVAMSTATSALADHDRLGTTSAEARVAYDTARRAYAVCNEGGALKMPLRRWVLAQELDRVTTAANAHLSRMTSGRYALRRSQDAKRWGGLDLEVLDSHTGRPRSTASLSGGEQFQASLALALGLADVVSHGGSSSGRVFEALFVDEGFGSLDQNALRDAIDALHQLQATGRTVGAITHVDAMKLELHTGIEVQRLTDGRGSTLVVKP